MVIKLRHCLIPFKSKQFISMKRKKLYETNISTPKELMNNIKNMAQDQKLKNQIQFKQKNNSINQEKYINLRKIVPHTYECKQFKREINIYQESDKRARPK